MIRRLSGTVVEIGAGAVVVDVRGVGYLVNCNTALHSFTEGSTVTLHTYLAVRETALDLYGFSSQNELALFELLLGIPKVGPKSAMQILSQATPTLLTEAAQRNDPVYLHKLSGIGKKTAENIVQFLSRKLSELPAALNTEGTSLSGIQTDAVDALIALGYETAAAREAIMALKLGDDTVNTLVTRALKEIR